MRAGLHVKSTGIVSGKYVTSLRGRATVRQRSAILVPVASVHIMNHEKRQSRTAGEAEARRDFLKNVGKMTATAPAVALLLAASAKSASAQSPYSAGDGAGDTAGDSTGGSGSGSS